MTAIFANKVRKILHKKIKGYSNCWTPFNSRGALHLFFKCAYTAKGRVQFLYLQSAFIY